MQNYLEQLTRPENATKFPMTFVIGFYNDAINVPQVPFIHRNFVNGQMKHLEEVLKELHVSRNSFAIFSSYTDSQTKTPEQKNVAVMFMFCGSELPNGFTDTDFYQGYSWNTFGTFSMAQRDDCILAFCRSTSTLMDRYQLLSDKAELK